MRVERVESWSGEDWRNLEQGHHSLSMSGVLSGTVGSSCGRIPASLFSPTGPVEPRRTLRLYGTRRYVCYVRKVASLNVPTNVDTLEASKVYVDTT